MMVYYFHHRFNKEFGGVVNHTNFTRDSIDEGSENATHIKIIGSIEGKDFCMEHTFTDNYLDYNFGDIFTENQYAMIYNQMVRSLKQGGFIDD